VHQNPSGPDLNHGTYGADPRNIGRLENDAGGTNEQREEPEYQHSASKVEPPRPEPTLTPGYDADDFTVVFGG